MSNLILHRKHCEEVVITIPSGDEIIVKVMFTHRGSVNLAFDAPANITINRREIHDLVKDKPILKNKRSVQ